jgi:hypothetical protein
MANQGIADEERLAYARQCADAVKRHPGSELRAALCHRIGDIYYDLGRTRYAGKWHAWYEKAAAARPSLIKETPIGFRLKEYSNIAKRKNVLAGVFAVYVLVLLSLVVRVLRSRRTFDGRMFLGRSALFFGIFTVMACAVFVIDLHCFSKSAETVIEGKTHIRAVTTPVRPFIPFSVMDPSMPARALWILFAGYLPIATAVLYTSYQKRYSRLFLSIMTLLFCTSLWTHFIITAGFDRYLQPAITATDSRVIFSGEPEKLLLENPARALHSCPGLLKSGNEDLELFIKQHYPGGFPAGKK